jgi:hypothetical protein
VAEKNANTQTKAMVHKAVIAGRVKGRKGTQASAELVEFDEKKLRGRISSAVAALLKNMPEDRDVSISVRTSKRRA